MTHVTDGQQPTENRWIGGSKTMICTMRHSWGGLKQYLAATSA